MDAIENKVAKSGLITLDLEERRPQWDIRSFDLEPYLFESLVLREKDFRAAMETVNWSEYNGAFVHVFCSAEAIIPLWAYMLVASKLSGSCEHALVGSRLELKLWLWRTWVRELDITPFTDQRVILKGCSKEQIHESIYMELTERLQPVVKSLMFGEPCSTVPVYKKK